eukprot:scaffold1328_cov394-Prasinococcus_capsulatus_cf.AAC.19
MRARGSTASAGDGASTSSSAPARKRESGSLRRIALGGTLAGSLLVFALVYYTIHSTHGGENAAHAAHYSGGNYFASSSTDTSSVAALVGTAAATGTGNKQELPAHSSIGATKPLQNATRAAASLMAQASSAQSSPRIQAPPPPPPPPAQDPSTAFQGHAPEPKLVEGIIQAGFPREKAVRVLEELGNENCCQRHIHWLFKNQKSTIKWPDDPSKLVCHRREHTDFDGYAVVWGIDHKTDTPEECCERCKNYKPK